MMTADYAAAKARRDARDQAAMNDARHDLEELDRKRAEERNLRVIKCKDCPKTFTYKPGMGRPPVRCETCRKTPWRSENGNGTQTPRAAREETPTPAKPTSTAAAVVTPVLKPSPAVVPDERPSVPDPSIIVTPRQFVVVLQGRIRALDRERALVEQLLALYAPIGGGGR